MNRSIQLILWAVCAVVFTGCEYEFTHEHQVENATQEALSIIFSDGVNPSDTVTVDPGATLTVESFTDPTARVPEAISCNPNRVIDTMIHASGRRVILEFDVEASWIVSDFVANMYQVCLFRLGEEGLE